MTNTTVACTNINLLKESQIPASPSQNELYAVELNGKPATESQLNQKADLNLSNVLNNIDYVVESKTPTNDDPTWYRVYRSGWVEQGGLCDLHNNQTIQLLKQMANTNYSVQLTSARLTATSHTGDANDQVIKVNCTTSSIYVYINDSNGNGTYWEVKGIKANG